MGTTDDNAKVFGIGLSKTGTTSLARALEMLGYRTRDYLGVTRYRAGDLSSVDLDAIRSADAFTDTPIPSFYRELDQAFPGSRFILTVREEGGWLKSCAKQFNQKHADNQNEATRRLFYDLYGTNVFDEEKFKAGYRRFVAGVMDHFKDRPDDLLVLDIAAGDGWEKLCAFLGKPIPEAPFPRANVTRIRWMDINQLVAAARSACDTIAHALEETQGNQKSLLQLLKGGRRAIYARALKRARKTILGKLNALNPEIPIITNDRPIPDYDQRREWNHFWLVNFITDEQERDKPPIFSIALIEDRRPIIGLICSPESKTLCYAPHGKPAVRQTSNGQIHPLTLDQPVEGCAHLAHCLLQNQRPLTTTELMQSHEWQTAAAQAILAATGCNLYPRDAEAPLHYNKPDMKNPPLEIRCPTA